MSADTSDATADTPTATSKIREAMAAATTSHEIRLAIDSYEWATPLDVVDVDEPVEWDPAFASDWWTRTIRVEGGRGATYELVYSSIGEPSAECYRYDDENDSRGDKRGDIEFLALVEEDVDESEFVVMRGASAGDKNVFHRPDPDDPTQPACQTAAKSGTWYRKDRDVLGDDWELCGHCDNISRDDQDDEHTVGDELPDDTTDDSEDDEDDEDPEQQATAEAVLPDGISESDVADAVDEHRTGPRPRAELGDVAETLGLDPNKTRTILVVTNNYRKVREVTSSKDGGR